MPCVNPDGSITDSAKALLKVIESPLTAEEISKKVGQPLFKIRSSLREMVGAELIKEEGNKYVISESGKEKI
jgi:predicted transcriptional regulator